MLCAVEAYERFIYSLAETFPSIIRSTLVLYATGPKEGTLRGEIEFDKSITLRVAEWLDFSKGIIRRYAYLVLQGDEKLYWYDSQPHPDDPSLADTHPHHKHVPPDIKRHRIPAPRLGFEEPNLPFLIEEIEKGLLYTE